MAFAIYGLDDIPMPTKELESEAAITEMAPPVVAGCEALSVAYGDQLAMDRWRRLTEEEHIGDRAGTLWIGSAREAVQWASQHVGYIVNAANQDYKWHPWCLRFWANINHKGVMNHVTHEHRMGVVVWLILTAMMMGEDVLVHCRQGKHRSGCVIMIIMMILGGAGRPKSWLHSEGPRS